MNRICNKKCPEHGDKCKVVEASKSDGEIAKRVLGCDIKFEGHVHLCLADPKNPHIWIESHAMGSGELSI